MNLLSLVGPRLDNICQIRRKWYYSSGFFFQSKRGLGGLWLVFSTDQVSRSPDLSECILLFDGNQFLVRSLIFAAYVSISSIPEKSQKKITKEEKE
jgi:hypothetical protein